jgi:hypothetical protein
VARRPQQPGRPDLGERRVPPAGALPGPQRLIGLAPGPGQLGEAGVPGLAEEKPVRGGRGEGAPAGPAGGRADHHRVLGELGEEHPLTGARGDRVDDLQHLVPAGRPPADEQHPHRFGRQPTPQVVGQVRGPVGLAVDEQVEDRRPEVVLGRAQRGCLGQHEG